MQAIIREARPDEYGAIEALTVAAYRTIDPDLGAYEARLRDVATRARQATLLVAVLDGSIVHGHVRPGTVQPVCRVGRS